MILTISLTSGIAASMLWFVIYEWRKRRWLKVIKRLRDEKHQTFHALICQYERVSLTESRLVKEEEENSRLRAKIRELRRNKRFIGA